MPADSLDVSDITVIGPSVNRNLAFPFDIWFRDVFLTVPQDQRFTPQTGNAHGVSIYYQGLPNPPSKPNLVRASITRLTTAVRQIGDAIAALADDAVIYISKTETITGAEMKARFAVLREIRVNQRQDYAPGYGGANYVSFFEISCFAEAEWSLYGGGSMRLLILHELCHNSATGDAIRAKNWSTHLSNGGTRESYIVGNTYFDMQESMTNKIALNLAASLGIDVARDYSTGYYGEEDYPPGGVYQGSDL